VRARTGKETKGSGVKRTMTTDGHQARGVQRTGSRTGREKPRQAVRLSAQMLEEGKI